MHLIALTNDIVRAEPELPRVLMKLYEDARLITEEYYHDPGYAVSVFAEQDYQRQKNEMGDNLWTSGLKANRVNLQHFMENMVDQGLVEKSLPIEDLFHPSVLDT
jgi:4,5-dihydroxyphthalate decarboxylase